MRWYEDLYVGYNPVSYTHLDVYKRQVLIVVSLLNFLIYWLRTRNKSRFNPKQVKRRHEYRQSVRQARPVKHENGALHKCYICGRTELDDPNLTFRYCSKCSGNKEYCQDHLFTHEHK